MAFFDIKSQVADMSENLLDASFFEGGNQVVQLAYPDDLWSMQPKYGNAFTAFFISVHQEEELAQVKGADGKPAHVYEDSYYDKDRKSGALATQSSKYGEGSVMLGTALAGALPTATSTYMATSGTPNTARIAKSVLSGVGVGAMSATGGNNLAFKQQKACIVLPTPSLQSSYNFVWESNNAQVVGGVVDAVGSVNNADTTGVWSKIGGVITALSSSTPMYGDTVSRMTGKSVNPRKEQIFKEPSFRQFSFSYQFAPRSEKEARNIEAIIRQFKYHSHPSLTAGDFLYRYPSEFDIVHYHNGSENLHLPKHVTSVLESVNVNYAPSETYTFFKNGMPSIIQLDLRFIELGVLTKDDIKKGY